MIEHEIKSQISAELQTLRDWGDKNVQIQSGTEAPPKKKWKKDDYGTNAVIYTCQSTLVVVSQRWKSGEESQKSMELWIRLIENMTTHDLDLENGSVFKWQFMKYEIKSFRSCISEM